MNNSLKLCAVVHLDKTKNTNLIHNLLVAAVSGFSDLIC